MSSAIGDLANRVRALSAGQVGTIWVAAVFVAAFAFWQYSEMPRRDQRFAALPNEQIILAQRSLADARRAESASNAQAESTMAMISRLATSNKNGFVPEFLTNTYKRESIIHSTDSTMIGLSVLSLRAAEDSHRDEIERRATWTQAIQYGLLTMLVVFVGSAIATTFVWFGRQAQESEAQSDAT